MFHFAYCLRFYVLHFHLFTHIITTKYQSHLPSLSFTLARNSKMFCKLPKTLFQLP